MPEASYVHPRLGEDKFRFYEPYLTEALNRWPHPTEFLNFGGMAKSTFVARFRDSLLGYRLNKWPAYTFDPARFAEVDPQACISIDTDGRVWYRSRKPVGRPQTGINTTLSAPPEHALDRLTTPELQALALLLNNGRLTGPFRLLGNHESLVNSFGYDNCFATYIPSENVTLLS